MLIGLKLNPIHLSLSAGSLGFLLFVPSFFGVRPFPRIAGIADKNRNEPFSSPLPFHRWKIRWSNQSYPCSHESDSWSDELSFLYRREDHSHHT